jgi:hypothetical protein
MNVSTQTGAFVLALAGVIGSTVAVCLGHIDTSTYVALVGPIVGAAAGVGAHAAGVTTTASGGGSTGSGAGS